MKLKQVPRPIWANHRVRQDSKARSALSRYFWVTDHGDSLTVCPAFVESRDDKAPPVVTIPEPLASKWRETMTVIE